MIRSKVHQFVLIINCLNYLTWEDVHIIMKQREFVSIGEIKVCKLAQAIGDKTRLFDAHRRLFFSRQKRVKNRLLRNNRVTTLETILCSFEHKLMYSFQLEFLKSPALKKSRCKLSLNPHSILKTDSGEFVEENNFAGFIKSSSHFNAF